MYIFVLYNICMRILSIYYCNNNIYTKYFYINTEYMKTSIPYTFVCTISSASRSKLLHGVAWHLGRFGPDQCVNQRGKPP